MALLFLPRRLVNGENGVLCHSTHTQSSGPSAKHTARVGVATPKCPYATEKGDLARTHLPPRYLFLQWSCRHMPSQLVCGCILLEGGWERWTIIPADHRIFVLVSRPRPPPSGLALLRRRSILYTTCFRRILFPEDQPTNQEQWHVTCACPAAIGYAG